MAGVLFGGWIGQSVVKSLVDKVASYSEEQYYMQDTIKSALEKLNVALGPIKIALDDAEKVQLKVDQDLNLVQWMWQLRDAVEEAEDVLDEMEYYRLEREIMNRDRAEVQALAATSSRRVKVNASVTVYRFKNKFKKIGRRAVKRDPTVNKLLAAVRSLELVIQNLDALKNVVSLSPLFGGNLGIQTQKNTSRETGFEIATEVIGRDKDKKRVLKWLSDESRGETKVLSALTIWGVGGVGKTTLAQHVYNDEYTRDYFQVKMWVCVSSNQFRIEDIMKKAISSATEKAKDTNFMPRLQQEIKEIIKSKRCLLVLDDVWDDQDPLEWESFIGLLSAHVERGSKILITSRIQQIGETILQVLPIQKQAFHLDCLREDEALSLFKKHALVNHSHDLYNSKLRSVAKRIVMKCGGLPLALKVVGGLLNSKLDINFWDSVLKKDTLSLDEGMDIVGTILKLSYEHLPSNLKNCFRLCSLFPKAYKFRKDEHVQLWIAYGIIHQSKDENIPLVDIGRDHFDGLVRRSFFVSELQMEKFGRSFNTNTEIYTMHDLLHDLARDMSKGECLRVDGIRKPQQLPKTLRHLSVTQFYPTLFKQVSSLQKLQSLDLSLENLPNRSYSELNDMLMKVKKLRALFIEVEFMPPIKAIRHLIHLRMLKLKVKYHDCPQIKSFFKLYHLQYLTFNSSSSTAHCDRIELDGLANLVNLKQLSLPKELFKRISTHQVKYLIELQKLELDLNEMKLSDMKDLDKLRYLTVCNIRKITSAIEGDANLEKKEYLETLSLLSGSGSVECDHLLEEQVYSCLQPRSQSNIKLLEIIDYGGERSPRWMTSNYLPYVTHIKLCNCEMLESLPPLGQLPSLRVVFLEKIPRVKQIGEEFFGSDEIRGFPSLEELKIWGMEKWKEWTSPENSRWFPSLKILTIKYCELLKELPALPLSLKRLSVYSAGLIALPAWQENDTNVVKESRNSTPVLEYLNIVDCLDLEIVQPFLSNCALLRNLIIMKCPKLFSSWNILDSLKSLSYLKLEGLASLTILPNANGFSQLTALDHLRIYECENLSSLGGLYALPYLTSLKIGSCNKLAATSSDLPQMNSHFHVKDLCIDNALLLRIEPLTSITSVETLDMKGDCQASFFPQWLNQNHTSLSKLHFGNMSSFSFLVGIPLSLTELEIYDCPNLDSLPDSMPSSLKILQISNCSQLKSLPDNMPSSLNILQIIGCPMSKLPENMPSALMTLTVGKCQELKSLPNNMPFSLTTLSIMECPELGSLPNNMPSSLMTLTIRDCPKLLSLQGNIPSSLRTLTISECRMLFSLPNKMPPSLMTLSIRSCPMLKFRYQAKGGSDWPKISHIPDLHIR